MELKEALGEIYKAAQEKFNIKETPKLILREDEENAEGIFGRTAYYEPATQTVVLYTTNRHPKDILRSISHELVHHKQNCEGKLKNIKHNGEGYAQTDKVGRECESEAYLLGNGFLVRDFQDLIYNKGEKKMLKQPIS